MHCYEKVGLHWNWMLPKVPVISKNALNKSWLKLLNFLQETQWTHISDSSRKRARELNQLLFLKYKALEWECKSLEPSGSTTWKDRDMRPLSFYRKFNFRLHLSKAFFSIIGTFSSVQPFKVNLLTHSRNPSNAVPLYMVLHHDSIIVSYNSFIVDRNSIVVDKNSFKVDRMPPSSKREGFPVGTASDSFFITHPLHVQKKIENGYFQNGDKNLICGLLKYSPICVFLCLILLIDFQSIISDKR